MEEQERLTLKGFIVQRLDDLTNNRIAPEEAFVLARQYPYLQELLTERALELLSTEGDGLRAVLIDVFRGAIARIDRELPPQVQDTQVPVEDLTKEEVTSQARLDTEARRAVRDILNDREVRLSEYRKGFIKRLVDGWIKRSGLTQDEAQRISHTIEDGLVNALSRVSTVTDVAHKVGDVFAETAQTVRVPVAPVIEEARAAEPRYEAVLGETERFRRILPAIVSHPEVHRIDWYARFASIESEKPEATVPEVAQKSLVLTKFAEAVTTPFAPGEDPTEAGVFFESFSKSPLAGVADAVFRTLSPEARQRVVSAVFTRAVGEVAKNSAGVADRIGEEFVRSPFFSYVLEQGKKGLTTGGVPTGLLKTRGVVEDVIGSVLGGPTASTILGSPTQALVHSLELVEKINKKLPEGQKLFILATTPEGAVLRTAHRLLPLPVPVSVPKLHAPPVIPAGMLRPMPPAGALPPIPPVGVTVEQVLTVRWLFSVEQFYPALIHSTTPSVFGFQFVPDIKDWFMRLFTKKAAAKAREKVAGKAVAEGGKGLLARILGTGAKAAGGGARKGVLAFLAAIAGKLGLSALAGLLTGGTSLLVQAGIWLGTTVLGPIWRFGVNILSGRFITSFFAGVFGGGGGVQKKWYQDWSPGGVLFPLFLVGSLLVVLVLSRSIQVGIDTPLAIGAVGGGLSQEEGQFGISTIPPYTGPLPPPSSISGCPISFSGGHISQCPEGSFSHSGTDAYDMAGSGIAYQPVRATHNGYVASYREGIPEGLGGGFGNYVRLVGTAMGGEAYYTIYAHFRNVSPRVVEAYDALHTCMDTPPCTSPPSSALITAGTVLGWVDDTGFSTGHHLHYQYSGPGTLQLPLGCGGWNGTCPAN